MLPATAIDRPPRAGPIDRQRSPLRSAWSTAPAGWFVAAPCASIGGVERIVGTSVPRATIRALIAIRPVHVDIIGSDSSHGMVVDGHRLNKRLAQPMKEREGHDVLSNLSCTFFRRTPVFDAAWLVLSVWRRRATMLFTIAVILLVLWLLGLVSGYTLGNFIYVLLVIALVLFVVGLLSGRRTV